MDDAGHTCVVDRRGASSALHARKCRHQKHAALRVCSSPRRRATDAIASISRGDGASRARGTAGNTTPTRRSGNRNAVARIVHALQTARMLPNPRNAAAASCAMLAIARVQLLGQRLGIDAMAMSGAFATHGFDVGFGHRDACRQPDHLGYRLITLRFEQPEPRHLPSDDPVRCCRRTPRLQDRPGACTAPTGSTASHPRARSPVGSLPASCAAPRTPIP